LAGIAGTSERDEALALITGEALPANLDGSRRNVDTDIGGIGGERQLRAIATAELDNALHLL
jgi:hypothetical protein